MFAIWKKNAGLPPVKIFIGMHWKRSDRMHFGPFVKHCTLHPRQAGIPDYSFFNGNVHKRTLNFYWLIGLLRSGDGKRHRQRNRKRMKERNSAGYNLLKRKILKQNIIYRWFYFYPFFRLNPWLITCNELYMCVEHSYESTEKKKKRRRQQNQIHNGIFRHEKKKKKNRSRRGVKSKQSITISNFYFNDCKLWCCLNSTWTKRRQYEHIIYLNLGLLRALFLLFFFYFHKNIFLFMKSFPSLPYCTLY